MKPFLFLIGIIPFVAIAQSKYDSHWTIGYDTSLLDPGGDMILIDFAQNPVSVQTLKTVDGFVSSGSGSTMSDNDGNLVFYTSGCYVINSENEIMENGDSINPGVIQQYYCPFGYSPNPGGSIAIPWPDSPNLYLLFISDRERTDFPGGPLSWAIPRHLYYDVIDMSKNAGLGKVVQKNQIAIEDTMARASIEACRHGNGRDWWVLIPKSRSNCYFLVLVTPFGVQPAKLICTGNVWTGDSGQACFTPDGTKFIRIENGIGLHIYDFDNISGTITYNSLIVPKDDFSSSSVGTAISPNSRYLYVSLIDKIFQYDLEASNIAASRILLAIMDTVPDPFVPSSFTISGLAPDGKIYISGGTSHLSLHVIHRPDCPGLYSLLERRGLTLSSWNYYSIPNMPHFRNEPSSYPCDSIAMSTFSFSPAYEKNNFSTFPNPATDQVTVVLSHPLRQLSSWLLFDQFGQIVKKLDFEPNKNEYIIKLNDIKSGIYFQSIRYNGMIIHQNKLVILREK